MNQQSRFTTLSKLLLTLLVIYLLIILLFVLFPRPVLELADPSALQLFLIDHTGIFYKILYAQPSAISISNFFLFTPTAFLIKLLFPKVKSAYIFIGFALLSLTIESMQLLIPGRVGDWRDLLANAVSGGAGLLLARVVSMGRLKI